MGVLYLPLGFFSLAATNNLLKASHDVMPPRERPIRTWLWNERTTRDVYTSAGPQEYLNLLFKILPGGKECLWGKKAVAFPFCNVVASANQLGSDLLR